MNQAGLLKFIHNVFPLLKDDTVIGIALLYLNHACHYQDVFA